MSILFTACCPSAPASGSTLSAAFLFLLPICVILTYFTWPWFVKSWNLNEGSSNAGGLLRWPVKLLLPVGFGLMVAARHLGAHQAHCRARARHRHRIQIRKAAAMSFIRDNLAPLMFAGMIVLHADRLSGGVLAGGHRPVLRLHRHRVRPHQSCTSSAISPISCSASSRMTSCSAIPFFTFMGAILERCGLAEDLFDSIGQLFGPVRGGMSYAVIFVGAVLGAITGTVAASVIAMGVISMTPMIKYGYSTRHTMGVIAASGTITQLIPPSLVLVVLADQLGRSVGDMYAGAIGPSIIQVASVLRLGADRQRYLAARTCRRCRSRRAPLHGWAALEEVPCAALSRRSA